MKPHLTFNSHLGWQCGLRSDRRLLAVGLSPLKASLGWVLLLRTLIPDRQGEL